MPKRTSAGSRASSSGGSNVVLITLDNHVAQTALRAQAQLAKDIPGVRFTMHAATDWATAPDKLAACKQDIATADILIVTMLFVEDHINAVINDLRARRDDCDALLGCMSAGEIVRLTKIGKFRMGEKESGAISFLKRLRGSKKDGSADGASQMKMLRRLPRILRFIPGTAQDLRAYFLTMQYWLACSDENMVQMVRLLLDRYGSAKGIKGSLKAKPPKDYPDTGLYHPSLKDRITEDLAQLPAPKPLTGTVGLVLMRAYVLAGDTGHYDGVIKALEARGLKVVPIFACGLDIRPAVERYFLKNGRASVDAVLSLTGFSMVGGPAYCNPGAAEETLALLNVPYVSAEALEFQTLDQWRASERGLMPVESTIMVAIPELDGATGGMVYGGRANGTNGPVMQVDDERAMSLAARMEKLVRLRRSKAKDRKIALTVFNFPPGAGAVGTAAYLDVFASLWNVMAALKADGYDIDLPASAEELRERVTHGNAKETGADANVHARIPVDTHVRRERHLTDIEGQWGPAPGRHQTDGRDLFILGERFGNVFVGLQPGLGYEGDPMRLLFEKGFAPTHAFAAYYSYLKEDFQADAVVHFGTHGALEFMPGKQTGLTDACWPDRLIGDLPNFYLYAANNPSEGMIAKRRGGATLVSYLTPPLKQSGLYKDLTDLKAAIERWRQTAPGEANERHRLQDMIQVQAAALDMASAEPLWNGSGEIEIAKIAADLTEWEESLIPYGLHTIGTPPAREERRDYIAAMAEGMETEDTLPAAVIDALADGLPAERAAEGHVKSATSTFDAVDNLAAAATHMSGDAETRGVLAALDGRFIRPVVGGDLLRTPEILPAGRNIHGFDPFRIPSAFACMDGADQAMRLLDRHVEDHGALPQSVAMVLWGTDNLKSEGGPIAQAMALMGAKPRHDSFGRLVGAELIPLEELGRPRIDVVMTLSGIFRDLLPIQMKMLAEAAYLASAAEDEPLDQNFVRLKTLEHQEATACPFEEAAIRVYSNADGAYGSNVNWLVDSGQWDDESELGDMFTQRKSFAYDREGRAVQREALMRSMLGHVDVAYQNLESIESGITTLDHYFDSLGGITRAASGERGGDIPVYIGDQTRSDGTVRSLAEQVGLETRTRILNPTWYEGMLKHGYEGVRQIEAHITNTVGWSATTGQVDPWVYKQLTETFVLDEEMRNRLAELNTQASARVANRLIEAFERDYWTPDDETLEALRQAGDELEDRLEGVDGGVAA